MESDPRDSPKSVSWALSDPGSAWPTGQRGHSTKMRNQQERGGGRTDDSYENKEKRSGCRLFGV